MSDLLATPLVITADDAVLDPVLAACATADVQPTVYAEAGGVRAVWSAAPVVIIGADQAESVARWVLPRRDHVFVVGTTGQREALCAWSVPLGASVIVLPDGSAWLASTLADARGGGDAGLIVAVIGGNGGVGASTIAAGLGWTAVRRGRSAMLIDLDPIGGGLDLLLGAEAIDGWRWPRLATARGHLGDLRGQVPRLEDLDLLSMSRTDEGAEPGVEAVSAVLGASARSHGLTIVDVGRGLAAGGREAIRRADVTLLVVGSGVRALAAASQVAESVRPLAHDLRLVVRAPRVATAQLAVQLTDLEVIGQLPDDTHLQEAAQRGDPPGRGNRRHWRRGCDQLLDRLVSSEQSGAA